MTTPETPSPYDTELRKAGQLASPTWELELFLSGALVFATLQMPDVVARAFSGLEPHMAGATRTVVNNLGIYARAIAYTLLITFTVHLIGRAHWVALMGLQSVYPAGVRWDEMKMGPIARKMYEEKTPTLSRAIASLDNFCSIVFSLGMMFVVLFVFSATLVGVVGAAGWGLARAFGQSDRAEFYFLGLVALFVAIPMVSSFIDKRMGPRLVPGTRGYRIVHGLLRASIAINMVRLMGPMMWTLMSNVGRKKAVAVMYVGLMSIMVLAAADIMLRRGSLNINNYDFFGPSLAHGVSNSHYENQRPSNASPRAPMIQSDIIRDPYVRLFIPYSPQRHNAALRRVCPGLKPLQEQGLQVGAERPVPDSLAVPALQCIANLHAVKLDGATLANADFSFYEHAATGLRGVVTYIPVDSLAKGRHVITIMPVPPEPLPTDSATLANPPWKQPFVIPFWR